MLTNRDDLLKREREEHEEIVRKSIQCRQYLHRHGMMAHYHKWQVKEKGAAPGVILSGTKKSGEKKKVFVKEYSHSLAAVLDLAAFKIIKKCGGRAPNVKLKASAERKIFLFSTDVSQPQSKHPLRKYEFHEFGDEDFHIASTSEVQTNYRLFGSRCSFAADALSNARILMLGMILNIWDLHDENTGVVFSTEGNAKLTFIDFSVESDNPECLENTSQLGLDGFIRVHHDRMWLDKNFNALIAAISVDDYVKAFEKIAMNFTSACKSVLDDINQLTYISDREKKRVAVIAKTWKQNFSFMQEMVMKAENHHLYLGSVNNSAPLIFKSRNDK